MGTGASILLFMVIYLFLSPGNSDFFNMSLPDQPVKFVNVKIMGRDGGQPSWYFEAENGYSTKNQDVTVLNYVSSGEIFKDGDPILRNLDVRQARIYREKKEIEAFKTVNDNSSKEAGFLNATINLAKLENKEKERKTDNYFITAEYMKFYQNEKRSEARRNVKAKGARYIIRAEYMEIDHDKEFSRFSDTVRLYRKGLFLTCSTLEFNSKEEKIDSVGAVNFTLYQKGRRTGAIAQKLTAYTDETKNIELAGPIFLSQAKKNVTAQNAIINESNNTLVLKGSIEAIFEKAQQILKPETIQQIENEETKAALREKTKLTSNQLMIYSNTENADAAGNVIITQSNKQARSDTASYNEKKDELTMTGNVWIKKENGWVKCQRVVVDIKNEAFTAVGEVKTEFILKKNR